MEWKKLAQPQVLEGTERGVETELYRGALGTAPVSAPWGGEARWSPGGWRVRKRPSKCPEIAGISLPKRGSALPTRTQKT